MNAQTAELGRRLTANAVLFAALWVAVLAPDTRAQSKDVRDLVDFRDEYKAPAVGLVLNYDFHPWRAGEKEFVLKRLREIRGKAPGLLERATACRPIRLYRVRGLPRADMAAVPIENAMLIPDGGLTLRIAQAEGRGNTMTIEERDDVTMGEQALFHELVHLADPFNRAARDKEWVAMIKPRQQRVNRAFLRRSGMTIEQYYRDSDRQRSLEDDLRKAAVAEGFPTPYAASNLVESLSEITSFLLVDPSYVPPVEVKAYLRRSFLSLPYKPDPATVVLHRAAESMVKGELDAALAALEELSADDPSTVEAGWYRSLIWEKKKDLSRAIAELAPAVDLTSKFEWRFLYRRALLHSRNGAVDQAIEDYTAVLKRDPTFQEILTKRGECLLIKGEYDKAIRDLDKAIQIRPKSSVAFGLRGMAWAGLKEFAKAAEDFDEAVWFDYGNHAALNGRARLRATCPKTPFRDGKLAVADALRASELTRWNEPTYLDTLAAAYAEAGEFKQAASWQKKAVEQAPAASKAQYRARLELYEKGLPFRDGE